MATATVDHDEVRRGISDRIGQLQQRRQTLALDTLDANASDDVHKELADVEVQIAEAGAKLERLSLAGVEQGHRDREAAEAAAARAREDALDRARTVAAERAKAAKAINKAATALGRAIAEHLDATGRLNEALVAAGRRPEPLTQPGVLTLAVVYGLDQAGVRRVNVELPPLVASSAPMDEQPPNLDRMPPEPEPVVSGDQPPRGLNMKPNSQPEEYARLVKLHGRTRGRREWASSYGYSGGEAYIVEMFDRVDREIELAANTNGENHG